MNSKSDHLFFLLNSNSIINSSARGIRKRFKYIFSNQNTFKLKSLISLTTFILLSLILSDQRIFKSRSFTFLIFINITRKQTKIVFFKVYSDRCIFERDFFRYNKVLNKAFRQFKRIFKSLNKDYVLIYLFNSIITLGNFTLESSSKSINDDDFFNIII